MLDRNIETYCASRSAALTGGRSNGWGPYIDPDEQVLWESTPSYRLVVFRPIDWLLVPFSIVWSMGAFTGAASTIGSGGVFTAFGLFFGAMAIYISVGRFVIDWYIRRNSVYAITDKRAFIAQSAFGRKLRELPITPALSVQFDDAARGSVWLDGKPGFSEGMKSMGIWHGDDGGFTFREIADPKNVYDLIQSVKRSRE